MAKSKSKSKSKNTTLAPWAQDLARAFNLPEVERALGYIQVSQAVRSAEAQRERAFEAFDRYLGADVEAETHRKRAEVMESCARKLGMVESVLGTVRAGLLREQGL